MGLKGGGEGTFDNIFIPKQQKLELGKQDGTLETVEKPMATTAAYWHNQFGFFIFKIVEDLMNRNSEMLTEIDSGVGGIQTKVIDGLGRPTPSIIFPDYDTLYHRIVNM
jgi:hypothetical protein